LPIVGDEVDGLLIGSAAELAGFGLSLVFVALLVACTFIDFDHQILPDRLTKPGMALGMLSGIWPGIAGPISDDPSTPFAMRTALASLAGMGAGILVTGGIRKLGSVVFRKEAMGLGDVKFLGMIGAFLGWQGALLTMFLGCIAGALIGGAANLRAGMSAKIPFGPYLAIGALVAMLAGGAVIELMFVSWPEWQRSNPASQPVVFGVAAVALLLMFVLVRRGRRHG
jgi:leader peptidase (prepilin peptidase)/N-methyltransferase